MNFGDFLYQLTARDGQALGLEYVQVTQTKQLTASLIESFWRVPADRALYVQSLHLEANHPTALVTSTEVLVAPLEGYLTTQTPVQRQANSSGQAFQNLLLPLTLFPNTIVVCKANYSTAAVGNTLICGLTGWLLPRGNLAISSIPTFP